MTDDRRQSIITLTTDFALQDTYVGQLKGAIYTVHPTVRIVDLCHAIPRHDILAAAVAVHSSYVVFPDSTVHLIIVDPGVGSNRPILAAASDKQFFIAPDNGILSLFFQDNSIEKIHRVENRALFREEISTVFHGRDIMAPVAAALALGMDLAELGSAVSAASCVQLNLPQPVIGFNSIEGHSIEGHSIEGHSIEGQVLSIDGFGNMRTNIRESDLAALPAGTWIVHIGAHSVPLKGMMTYADAAKGSLLALSDSSGFLEIAINQGNAAETIKCVIASPVTVRLKSS